MSTHTDSHSHGGPKIYTANLFALLFLTVLTIAAASFNFGSANVVIALAIASVKATLVALFFMHLVWDKPVNAIIAIAGFLFLGIFLMFDFLDVTSRVNFLPLCTNKTPTIYETLSVVSPDVDCCDDTEHGRAPGCRCVG